MGKVIASYNTKPGFELNEVGLLKKIWPKLFVLTVWLKVS